jgi:hypothetical protein
MAYIRVALNSGFRLTKLRVHPMRRSRALGEHEYVQGAALLPLKGRLVLDGS